MPKKDFSQVAFDVVRKATGEVPKTPELSERQQAARKGGLAGGKARAEALSKDKRSSIASTAAKARWKEK